MACRSAAAASLGLEDSDKRKHLHILVIILSVDTSYYAGRGIPRFPAKSLLLCHADREIQVFEGDRIDSKSMNFATKSII